MLFETSLSDAYKTDKIVAQDKGHAAGFERACISEKSPFHQGSSYWIRHKSGSQAERGRHNDTENFSIQCSSGYYFDPAWLSLHLAIISMRSKLRRLDEALKLFINAEHRGRDATLEAMKPVNV